MINKIITKKCLLKTIVKDEAIINLINQKVSDYNYTIILVYQLIKGYWIYQYELNNDINIKIDESFINICFNILSITKNSGRKIKNEDMLKSVKSYYDTYFSKTINVNNIKNLSKTRFIKQYQIQTIITAINNNIKFHFEKRLFRYLKSEFLKESITTKEKDEIEKEIKILKRDLINNNCTNDKYKDWFNNNKNKLLPEGDYYKILDNNPNKLLNYMFYMNNKLEEKNKKMFNCLPLRNNCISKYITIDTASLIEMTKTKNIGKMLKDISSSKIIWDEYFKTNKKIFKSNKCIIVNKEKYKYKFNGMIITDGIGVSVLLNLLDKNGNELKERKKKNNNEFKYFTEIIENELEELKTGKKIYIDPGKRNLICCIDDYDNKYIYRNGRRMFETKRKRNLKIIDNELIKNNIKEIEKKLNELNGKTNNHEKYLNFIKIKNEINEEVLNFYEKELFRKIKFRSFTLRQKSESKVVNELKEKYGSDIILLYGDKNIGPQMKRFISTPMIGFKRMLSKHFKLYEVDEFRTSKLDHKTTDENVLVCKNGKDKNGKKIHGVLVSKILVKGSVDKYFNSFQNRDMNGCKNIRKIVKYGLENEMKRPYWYRREDKLPSA